MRLESAWHADLAFALGTEGSLHYIAARVGIDCGLLDPHETYALGVNDVQFVDVLEPRVPSPFYICIDFNL